MNFIFCKLKNLLKRKFQSETWVSRHIQFENTDEFEKQRHWLQRALEVFQNMHGNEHASIASALMNLSKAYDNLHNYEQERDLLKEALTIMENCCEEYEILHAMEILSEAYYKLDDHEMQCETLERVLNMKQTLQKLKKHEFHFLQA